MGKKFFLKEGLLVFALIVVFSLLVEFFEPKSISKEQIFSPQVFLLGVIILFFPLFAGFAGGYFVSKKTSDLKLILFTPAVAGLLAGIVLSGIGLVQVFSMTDAQVLEEVSKASELGIDFFEGMGAEQLRSFFVTSALTSLVFLGLLNFCLCLAGAFLGNVFSKNVSKK